MVLRNSLRSKHSFSLLGRALSYPSAWSQFLKRETSIYGTVSKQKGSIKLSQVMKMFFYSSKSSEKNIDGVSLADNASKGDDSPILCSWCSCAEEQRCPAMFRSKSNAAAHAKSADKRVRYPCPDPTCQKVFTVERYVAMHVKRVHPIHSIRTRPFSRGA